METEQNKKQNFVETRKKDLEENSESKKIENVSKWDDFKVVAAIALITLIAVIVVVVKSAIVFDEV